MSRSKKLIRNTIFIGIILCGFYYFGGFYISKETCIQQIVKGLYGNETEVVMEFQDKNKCFTILTDEEKESLSIVGTNQYGFLYKAAIGASYVGHEIVKEEHIDVTSIAGSEIGRVIVVVRNDERVAKVVAEFENGETQVFEEWNQGFSTVLLEEANWWPGVYKAYDSEGQLLGNIRY